MHQDFAIGRTARLFRSARTLFLGLAMCASAGVAASASTCGQLPGPGMEPGRHDFSILSNGQKRDGVYFVPSAYDGKKPLPVVFDFHGSNSNPHGQLNRSGWDKLAERDGVVVVALAGSLNGELPGTHAWNVPGVTKRPGGLDEVGFIRDAITMVKGRFCVDEERFYGSGYSGGGRMLSQFICNGGADFTAAGFVASLRAGYPLETEGKWGPDAASCKPARPMSIIAFAGLKDPANPYQGGGKSYWQYGGETALKRWAEMDGCKGAAKSKVGESFTVNSYDVCKAGARIQSYVIENWDHAWPRATMKAEVLAASAVVTRKPGGEQTPKAEPAVERKMPTGEVTRTVDAAERMWDFFRNTEGQLVVDAVVKKDCGAKASSASASASETACSSNSKSSSLPVVKTLNSLSGSNAPVAEDAL
ncbi:MULTISPECIES: alpha/beta hydrolase family esterase [Agrobacterium]|uniref:Polyhydroxybutyrate depolymerase n=1 Tax=Agrobacterium salinitolerans TaxID=1183413 RepID=A0A9X3KQ99_9HYPH|nr:MULTISPECIES: polyhydroxybutyrate depolymerase [Agrobacterium]MCZ7938987.1 polyhydroxybutyrate depolymerase [Agrobacterium salinitolerans]MDA5640185.1 polyhydroxybutyrate depolymerase [Agrobacterium sp. ST15.13.013]MDA7000124.1 polyhydroxybutyrate depolymerase [Agrobacterium salinitolerans]